MADDVRWRSLAGGRTGMAFAALCNRKGDVRNHFLGCLASDREMHHDTPEHCFAQDDRVVMRGACAWRHRRTGKPAETPTKAARHAASARCSRYQA